MGTFVILVTALALGSAQADVTLPPQGTRVGPLIEAIGKQSGLKLLAGNVRDEVVLVRVQKRPAKEVLDRLANLLQAEWQREGETLVLTRTPAQSNALKAKHLERRVAQVERLLDAATKELADPFDEAKAEHLAKSWRGVQEQAQRGGGPELYNQKEQLKNLVPGRRLLLRVAQALGPRSLASLEWRERRVYSLRPTPMQLDLARVAPGAAETYVREQNVWADTVQRVGPWGPSDSRMVDDPDAQTGSLSGFPEGAVVVLTDGLMEQWPFRLQLVNALDGRILADYMPRTATMSKMQTLMDSDTSQSGTIEVDEAEKDFLKRLRATMEGKEVEPLSPAEADAMRKCDRRDPLDFVVPRVLATLAGDRSYLASLTDTVAAALMFFMTERPDMATLGGILAGLGVTIKREDDWVAFTPADTFEVNQSRFDRAKLAAHLAPVGPGQAPEGLARARFAFDSPAYREENALSRLWVILLSLDRHFFDMHIPGDRFLGSLSEAQLQVLRSGVSLSTGALGPQATTELRRYLFGGPLRHMGTLDDWAGQTFRSLVEPTVAFAQGIPSDGTLRLEERDTPAIVTYRSANGVQRVGVFGSAGEFGAQMGSLRPEAAPGFFRRGTSRVMRFVLEFPDQDVRLALTVTATTADASKPAIAVSELNEAERARYDAAYNQSRRAFGGSVGKPPP